MSGLACHGLTVGTRLRAVDAALRAGEVTAICGPNGAGKSTLLSCLAGLLAPTSGTVSIEGTPLSGLSARERARAIGYLPQSPEIAWDLGVETLIELGLLPWHGAPAGENRAAVEHAIAAMDLEGMRGRPVSRLSGGERARALMARVLATRPSWLLADEPLASLDLAHAAALVTRLRDQARDSTGVVLVLHDLAAAMNHADRVLVLHEGALVADGRPEVALDEGVIADVWGVAARWLGEPGARALAV